jgi:uncharacterized protein (TIGR03435 family)
MSQATPPMRALILSNGGSVTGLAAKYDFKLRYAGRGQIGGVLRPHLTDLPTSQESMPTIQDPGGAPDLFTAIEKQLGLKLTKGKSVLEVLVIDHAERGSN